MNRAGRYCKLCKIDWADAYKHIAVRQEDTDLQWFKWLGMAFKELCLIFGSKSSVGIFDRTAKLIVFIVIVKSQIDQRLVCQHLDDCCAAAPADSLILERFDETFSSVAADLGIQLAPRDDPEKSFAPCNSGTVLGITYDSVDWTWSLRQDKLLRILHLVREIVESDHIAQSYIWTIAGKILNIMPLVPGGRFNVDYILKAQSFSLDRNVLVPINNNLRRQLMFWYDFLQVCSGRCSIPNPDMSLPPLTKDFYTYAAGGSWSTKCLSVGFVSVGSWAVIPLGLEHKRQEAYSKR